MMGRLTEKDAYWYGEEFWTSAKEPDDETIDEVYMKLKEYEDAEEQGLLVKLPCKVGSTVYVITTCKDFGKCLTGYHCPYELNELCPHEGEEGCEYYENTNAIFEDCVESICMYEHEIVVFLINCGSISFSDFGKTIFLTKEEAEAALAKMESEV